MSRDKDELRDKFLETARSYIGYTARPGIQSHFGSTVGYPGLTWSGSFIDVVARESGVLVPACVNTSSGLAEFIYQRRWHARPRPGDIAFMSFATDPTNNTVFGMGHVGIVTGADRWFKDGSFETIEGQVNSGMPKGGQLHDGVYSRVRWRHEVLGFGRPAWRHANAGTQEETGQVVRLAHLRTGKRHASIVLVQRALAIKCGLRSMSGTFNGETVSALARWQRSIGNLDGQGQPDLASLTRLGRETGLFTVTE